MIFVQKREKKIIEMGNNCVNSRVAKLGFIQAISNSLWGPKQPEKIDYDSKEASSELPSMSKEKEGPLSVQDKPPEMVIIVKEGNNLPKPEEILKIVKEEEKPARATKWEDVVKEKREDTKSAHTVKPDHGVKTENEKLKPAVSEKPAETTKPDEGIMTGMEKPKPVEPTKKKVPQNVKRMASAGLLVDSVLRTKTGHLKEYFNLGEKLGNGQFGTTFLCVEKGTGKQYACKSIAKRKLLTKDDVEDVRREIEIMHHLSGCPNIISIKGAYEDSVAVHVVMELCSGGELFDRIVKRGHYTERKAAELARTIVGSIETCHSLGVMHRDLKPENFLFVNEEEDSPIKTIDFGLSAFFKPGILLQYFLSDSFISFTFPWISLHVINFLVVSC